MENDIKTQEKQENDGYLPEKKKSNISIFWIRFLVCMVLLSSVIFIKFNNQCTYDGIKFWYQNNFGIETISTLQIKAKAKELILPLYQKIKNR